jgi:putative transposase
MKRRRCMPILQLATGEREWAGRPTLIGLDEGDPRQSMRKSFKYRLYPTKRQQRLLSEQVEEVRWLWNTLLAQRKQAWGEQQETIDSYDQQAALPSLKAAARPGLKQVHSQVVQDVALRLQKALDAFFGRLKAGENPGYPRVRGQGRYNSLTSPQWENGVRLSASGTRLVLSKVGEVKMVFHRSLEGPPKTATLRRTGKWYVPISCEWESLPLVPTGNAVGIDRGLKTVAALRTGDNLENPRFFGVEEESLGRAQRQQQWALDAHQAMRAGVTERVQQAHPEWGETDLWHAVSQDAQEQAAWKRRQKRR